MDFSSSSPPISELWEWIFASLASGLAWVFWLSFFSFAREHVGWQGGELLA
jgi:hypothetical protein